MPLELYLEHTRIKVEDDGKWQKGKSRKKKWLFSANGTKFFLSRRRKLFHSKLNSKLISKGNLHVGNSISPFSLPVFRLHISIHLQTIWLTTLSIVFLHFPFDIDLKTIHQIVMTRRSHSNFQHLCPVNSFGKRTSGSGSELIHLLTKTVWSEKWNV